MINQIFFKSIYQVLILIIKCKTNINLMSNVLSKLLVIEDSSFYLNYQKKNNNSFLFDKEIINNNYNLKAKINTSQLLPEP